MLYLWSLIWEAVHGTPSWTSLSEDGANIRHLWLMTTFQQSFSATSNCQGGLSVVFQHTTGQLEDRYFCPDCRLQVQVI